MKNTKHPLLMLADEMRLKDDLPRALNPARVSNAKAKNPVKLWDGGGLFLHVLPSPSGKPRRLWRYKFRINGRENVYAVGPFPEIGLADARVIHLAARHLVEHGINPARYAHEQRQRIDHDEQRQKKGTFAAVCETWLARDAKKLAAGSMAQRRRELRNDVLPPLGGRLIGDIRKAELTDLLHKIEKRGAPEVARNVLAYLAGIFDYAIDAGLVTGSPVPGRKVLRPRNQAHHAAMPLAKVGKFLRAVDDSDCNRQTAIALRLLVLTAVRKHELIGARWSEFDMGNSEWSIPAARMKMRSAHWVPLAPAAVELLKELRKLSPGALLFPNARDSSRPMAGRSLNALLGRLGYLEHAKPHGFRAVFSTHFNGAAGWNPDVVEKCLAHVPKNAVRAAYDRNEHRDDRRKMMRHWAQTVDALVAGGDVVALKRGAA